MQRIYRQHIEIIIELLSIIVGKFYEIVFNKETLLGFQHSFDPIPDHGGT